MTEITLDGPVCSEPAVIGFSWAAEDLDVLERSTGVTRSITHPPIDPALAPAVCGMTAGGLTFHDAIAEFLANMRIERDIARLHLRRDAMPAL